MSSGIGNSPGRGFFGLPSKSPTPSDILGSRLKRHYVATSGSTTRTWYDVVVGDTLTMSGTPGYTTTPHGNPAPGCITGRNYIGGTAIGGGPYKNLLFFGGFWLPTDCYGTFNFMYASSGFMNAYLNTNNNLYMHCYASTSSSGEAQNNANIKNGAWHRFVFHYTNDGDAGHGKLYFDGYIQGTQQTSGGDLYPSSTIELGAYYNATGSTAYVTSTGFALGGAGNGFSAADITAIDTYLYKWI